MNEEDYFSEDVEDVEENEESGTSFSTPLWMQRRQFIRQVIDENKATSVIDLGCGEGALTTILIGETWQDHQISKIACVDIDLDCVSVASKECQPQDYDLGVGLRIHNLTIDLYQGSVAEADSRLLGYDALACAEVVEHLHPKELNCFWGTVLGAYSPRIVVVTTPNAECNVNFPQLKYGTPEATFRHWDHKFEWTRREFEEWCTAAAQEYGYSVTFSGVGYLAQQDPAVGPCTQIAVLKRMHSRPNATVEGHPYNLHSTIEYPVYETVHSEEETLAFLHETLAHLRPRIPREASPDDYWASYGEPDVRETTTQSTESDVQLGQVEVENLWSVCQVRQHCQSQRRMIELLQKSPLVQVDEKRNLITFDEENPFWKECDDRYEAARAAEDEVAFANEQFVSEYSDDQELPGQIDSDCYLEPSEDEGENGHDSVSWGQTEDSSTVTDGWDTYNADDSQSWPRATW
ncbi:Small RNA 2'-O-methyltransferase [Podila epigama]|nr:Small RNA 2'-O-methyltransferase [Podila epigama]